MRESQTYKYTLYILYMKKIDNYCCFPVNLCKPLIPLSILSVLEVQKKGKDNKLKFESRQTL